MRTLAVELDWTGVALLAVWLSWAVLCALALRMALRTFFARVAPKVSYLKSALLSYAAMIALCIASMVLLFLAVGEPDPEDVASLFSFLMVPLSVPLAVGCIILLPFELLFAWARMVIRHLMPSQSAA